MEGGADLRAFGPNASPVTAGASVLLLKTQKR